MEIGGWEKTSLVDYPGKICCIVYTIGCSMRCKFCYNGDLLSEEAFSKSDRKRIYEYDIFDYIEEHSKMLEAVSITGGEPTLQRDLPIFCQKIKWLNKLVKIDTNGTDPNQLQRCITMGVVDYIAMDLKGPPGKYKQVTGVDFSKNIMASINAIKNSELPHEFRVTLYPKLTKQDVIDAISLVSGSKVFLQKFEPDNALFPDARKTISIPENVAKEIIEETKDIADVQLRGF